MFDGPEYESYIVLMSELRLKWKFKTGDWWATIHREPIAWKGKPPNHEPIYISDPHLCNDDGGNFPGYEDDDQSYFPLPRLDQWLVKLEEARIMNVVLRWMHGPVWMAFEEHHDDSGCVPEDYQEPGFGSTREEASARLWVAVTGKRTVEST